MQKYVAFLRAINVGGTKIIKMDDLKRIFTSFGLANVQTYIATGNIIFETKAASTSLRLPAAGSAPGRFRPNIRPL